MKAKHAPRRSPSPDPAPVRQVRIRHPRATLEAISGLLDYHDQTLSFVVDPEANSHPNTDLLLAGLPQGPVQVADIEVIEGRLSVCFVFEPFFSIVRRAPPSAFLVLRALCLFEGVTTEQGRVRAIDKAGLPILGPGFTFMRLLADADAGEEVQLIGEEGNLWPQAFRIARGRHLPERRRDHAINHALRQYEREAGRSDIGEVISLEVYEALLKGAFRLFDAEHAKHFLRPLSGLL